jgi:hypothetical protein
MEQPAFGVLSQEERWYFAQSLRLLLMTFTGREWVAGPDGTDGCYVTVERLFWMCGETPHSGPFTSFDEAMAYLDNVYQEIIKKLEADLAALRAPPVA